MAEERVINLSKVQVGLEKIGANPELLKGVNAEFEKLFAEIGVELSWEEKSYLLAQLTVIGTRGGRAPEGLYEAIPAS